MPASMALPIALGNKRVQEHIQYIKQKRPAPFRCALICISSLHALSLFETAADLHCGDIIHLFEPDASKRTSIFSQRGSSSTPPSSLPKGQRTGCPKTGSACPVLHDKARILSFPLDDINKTKDYGDYAVTRTSTSSSHISQYHTRSSLGSDYSEDDSNSNSSTARPSGFWKWRK